MFHLLSKIVPRESRATETPVIAILAVDKTNQSFYPNSGPTLRSVERRRTVKYAGIRFAFRSDKTNQLFIYPFSVLTEVQCAAVARNTPRDRIPYI